MNTSASSNFVNVRQKVFFKDISEPTVNRSFLNDSTVIVDDITNDVHFEDYDDDEINRSAQLEPSPLTRTPSNLNHKAKLDQQARILKQKREPAEKDKLVPGAASNNLPRNINLYTNESQGVHGIYATQPDDEPVETNLKKQASKLPTGASLVNSKIKSSNRLNPKRVNSIDYNDNIVNGMRLKAVTRDFSKDYSSSDGENEAVKDGGEFSHPADSVKMSSSASSPNTKSLLKSIFHSKETNKSKSVDFVERIVEETDTGDMMVAPMSDHSSNEEEENEEAEEDEDKPDFSMFELIGNSSKLFCIKPSTMGLTIRCQIFRQKGDCFFFVFCNINVLTY